MALIKLTDDGGDINFVNVDEIVFILFNDGSNSKSLVYFRNSNVSNRYFRETPEEIYALVEKAEKKSETTVSKRPNWM